MKKTVFITGASRGFGKIWAQAFLKRGDNVVATARNLAGIKDLVEEYAELVFPLELDVTNRDQCFSAVEKGYNHFGNLDVVINNAGYGLFGTIEEVAEKDVRDQFETNVFGSLWVSQAAIPIMRSQGKGHIIQVSSILGVYTVPTLGIYNASKWAVEAISESMAAEINGFGIKTTLIEPSSFATDWANSSAVHSKSIDAYDNVKSTMYTQRQKIEVGSAEATADAILKIVDVDNPPLRILFGKMAYQTVEHIYNERLSAWNAWKDVSDSSHG